jgi:hypothetical protein
MLKPRAVRVSPVDAIPIKEAGAAREPLRILGWRVGDYVVFSAATWKIGKLVSALDPIAHSEFLQLIPNADSLNRHQ